MAFEQCPRQSWLKREGRIFPIIDEESKFRMEVGNRIHSLLKRLHPTDGVRVDAGYRQWQQAIDTTESLLNDPAVNAIFEGAFYATIDGADNDMGIAVRLDMLRRNEGGTFDLTIGVDPTQEGEADNFADAVEAKSIVSMFTKSRRIDKHGNIGGSERPKEQYLLDLAVQLWVLEKNGIGVRQANLMHLSGDYVHGGGKHDNDYEVQKLFTTTDLTEEARGLFPLIEEALLPTAKDNANFPYEPEIATGRQCNRPYPCGFKSSHCLPEELGLVPPVVEHPCHVFHVFRINDALRAKFALDGITDVRQITDPATYFDLTTDIGRQQWKQIERLKEDAALPPTHPGNLYRVTGALLRQFARDGITDLRQIDRATTYFDLSNREDRKRWAQIQALQEGRLPDWQLKAEHHPSWHPYNLYRAFLPDRAHPENNSRTDHAIAVLLERGITDVRTLSDEDLAHLRNDKGELLFDPDKPVGRFQLAQIRALRDNEATIDYPVLHDGLQKILAMAEAGGGKVVSFDFEAMNAALPIVKGSYPYEQVPIQFSCHTLDIHTGELEHFEYLYTGTMDGDPYTEIVTAMQQALGNAHTPVVVWFKQYEKGRFRELAARMRANGREDLAQFLDQLTSDAAMLAYLGELRRRTDLADAQVDYLQRLVETGDKKGLTNYLKMLDEDLVFASTAHAELQAAVQQAANTLVASGLEVFRGRSEFAQGYAAKIEAALGNDTLLRDLAEGYFRPDGKKPHAPKAIGERLLAIIADQRTVDGLEVVQDAVFAPGMFKKGRPSLSLKPVADTFVQGGDLANPYEQLAVTNGLEAGRTVEKILDPDTDAAEREQLIRDVLKYCRSDTENPLIILFGALLDKLNKYAKKNGKPELALPYQFKFKRGRDKNLAVTSSTRL